MDTLSFSKTEIINLHQSEKVNFITQLDGDILFKNTDVILILHKGEQYSLRRTRNGKLILNKQWIKDGYHVYLQMQVIVGATALDTLMNFIIDRAQKRTKMISFDINSIIYK